MTEFSTPFNIKEEKKKLNEAAKAILDLKTKKEFISRRTKEIDDHAEMLRKMSAFVNAKNKNKR